MSDDQVDRFSDLEGKGKVHNVYNYSGLDNTLENLVAQ